MTEDNNPALEQVLANYRAEISTHPLFVLRILVVEYGLVCIDTRDAYIHVLVEHFRQQLLTGS